MLEKVDISKRHLVANGLMSAFKKIFGEERFSDRIQYILNNIILALLENENESLLGVNRMLIDKEYRKYIISNVKDPSVRSFWLEEFVKAGDKYQQEAAPGIQNKIGQFISNPLIRNIIGQQRTSFDIRDIMDNKKILIVNLSKGKVGEGNANLIGSLLITKIYLAAMSRADAGIHELEKLPPFYFYVDEFQNFANESFANILSEARKYNLALTVAHQYVEQMTDEVKAAVFGNVGSMVVFRVGATDAEIFEKEFAPYFILDDIVNLGFTQIYLRLMIDGVGSKPFSAKTLGPIKRPTESFVVEIIGNTRTLYAKKVGDAEEEIRNWYEPRVAPPKAEAKAGDVSTAPAKAEVEHLPRERKVEQVPERRREVRRDEVRRDEGRRGESGIEKRKTNSSPVTRYDTIVSEKEAGAVIVPSAHMSGAKREEGAKDHDTKKEVTEMRMDVKEKMEEVVEVMIPKVEKVERENVKEDTYKESHVKGGDRDPSPHSEKEQSKGNSLKDALLKAIEEKKLEDEQKEMGIKGRELLPPVVKKAAEDKIANDQREKKEEGGASGGSAVKNSQVPEEISEEILKPLIEETPL